MGHCQTRSEGSGDRDGSRSGPDACETDVLDRDIRAWECERSRGGEEGPIELERDRKRPGVAYSDRSDVQRPQATTYHVLIVPHMEQTQSTPEERVRERVRRANAVCGPNMPSSSPKDASSTNANPDALIQGVESTPSVAAAAAGSDGELVRASTYAAGASWPDRSVPESDSDGDMPSRGFRWDLDTLLGIRHSRCAPNAARAKGLSFSRVCHT
jgi:hypothetical protein